MPYHTYLYPAVYAIIFSARLAFTSVLIRARGRLARSSAVPEGAGLTVVKRHIERRRVRVARFPPASDFMEESGGVSPSLEG